jgi:biotin synthase
MQKNGLRYDWTNAEVESIYSTPLIDMLFRAQSVHRQYFDPNEVQLCQLLSIKTGGCPEDCAYCVLIAHKAPTMRPVSRAKIYFQWTTS